MGITGRLIATGTACTSGSRGIGYAYQAIRFAKQDFMLAGAGEGLCPAQAAVFYTLFATSAQNDTPTKNPGPFDKERDSLVTGEVAGTIILGHLKRWSWAWRTQVGSAGANGD